MQNSIHLAAALSLIPFSLMADCGSLQSAGSIRGMQPAYQLDDGTLLGRAKVNINIDGYGRAYHPENAAAGALIHLCNAGKVNLPDGSSYQGSENNQTCTGKFMQDFQRIGAANWRTPSIGAIEWYGILGQGSVVIAGKRVNSVVPVANSDGSGFYVSPTAFFDSRITNQADQSRYANPMIVPAAVIPRSATLQANGVGIGSFGVAVDPRRGIAVPFVVGDLGPRVGEATPALARALAGLPAKNPISRAERFEGQVDQARVVWFFFGDKGGKTTYKAEAPEAAGLAAKVAYETWGGAARLTDCLASLP
ncbi:hypothetical protein [Paracoccus sulfuroxidans]|uniref:Chitosanase (Glycosyl hydrolase group 75) n=1 Tax=Paracoccus sulfuroxidans TaxID=384678 RepID=A0A562P0N9_9RHOB|nr:hypothetical protein [Paracoccus sulfuroxidans]TWI37921.1 hypothetical protein IQ24_00052 [Paracoccus sulfuroxidans]